MVKQWTFVAVVAAVTLLPVGAAEGRSDLVSAPPFINVHVSGELGSNGWHIGDTTVGWSFGPAGEIKSSVGCDTRTVDKETKGIRFTCTVTNKANQSVSMTYVVKLDMTPPTVRPRPTRPADRNGWFNHRVGFTPGGSDAISGVDTCTAIPTYSGPDRANARITARCRNMAGHQASGTFLLDYDDTAPRVRGILGRRPDRYGWYARDVRVRFAGSDAVSRVAGCSSKVYRGPDTARASVTGWCRDRAGNRRNRTRWFRFSKPLLEPRRGARVTSAPLLDWVDVPRARGYNAQVWHDGRKLLSKWPDNSRLQLHRGWRYQGTKYRLRRGETYKVYVWPRFRRGYGRLVGRGSFTFVRSSSGLVEVAAAGLEPATHGL
jgi:hypothetical protein